MKAPANIKRYFLGHQTADYNVEISKEEYEKYLIEKRFLRTVWDIEDVFGLLADSFVALEELLLSLSVNYAYSRPPSIELFFEESREKINLKAISFLTATRIYQERITQSFPELRRMKILEIDEKEYFSGEFDSSLEYRVMYGLRNFALHGELPINSVTFSSHRQAKADVFEPNAPFRNRVSIAPTVSVASLLKSEKFRQKTKAELSAILQKDLDLKFMARCYTSSLARVHHKIRGDLSARVDAALSVLGDAKARIEVSDIKLIPFLELIIEDEVGNRSYEMFDGGFYGKLPEKMKAWGGLSGAARTFVSSEVTQSRGRFPEDDPALWIPI